MLNDEAALVIEQENSRMATEATLTYAAAAAVMSPKEGGEAFRQLIDGMDS
jgi:hypothetical protein